MAIRGKGRGTDREWITLPPACVALLREWLAARGPGDGPVFTSKPDARPLPLDRAELRARIGAERTAGSTYRQIADALNAEGCPSTRGVPWDANSVHAALRNPLRKRHPRIPDRELNRIMDQLSRRAGIGKTRPHGLRHHAITRVLDLSNGNIRMAPRWRGTRTSTRRSCTTTTART